MPTFLLIGMAAPMRVISRHETAEAAEAAKEAFTGPSNIMDLAGDFPGFTGVDLVQLFNSLQPEVANRVARFETRAKGLDRVKRALAPPGTLSVDPAILTAAPPAAQEKVMSAKKKSRAKRPDDEKVTLTVTPKGEKARFNEGSARGRVFAAIGNSPISMVELVRKCSHFANKAQVRGCVDKLKINGHVKEES